jgi:hypothetical protein
MGQASTEEDALDALEAFKAEQAPGAEENRTLEEFHCDDAETSLWVFCFESRRRAQEGASGNREAEEKGQGRQTAGGSNSEADRQTQGRVEEVAHESPARPGDESCERCRYTGGACCDSHARAGDAAR